MTDGISDANEFPMDDGMPIKPKKTGRKAMYPFGKMEIGQSFFVPGKQAGNAARAAVSKYARTAYATKGIFKEGHEGDMRYFVQWTITGLKTFITRAEGDGVRIWRGKDEPVPDDRRVPVPGFPGKFFIID